MKALPAAVAILTIIFQLAGQTRAQSNVIVTAERTEDESACDWKKFIETAQEVQKIRETRRLSAARFAEMMNDRNTIVLDARGERDFERLHVRASINVPFTSFSRTKLRQAIPNESETRILIYCRNNLVENKDGSMFLEFAKDQPAGLNIPVFITLYLYGYKDVWELDPAVDPNDSPIPFVRGGESDTPKKPPSEFR